MRQKRIKELQVKGIPPPLHWTEMQSSTVCRIYRSWEKTRNSGISKLKPLHTLPAGATCSRERYQIFAVFIAERGCAL
jgi:hypothetical protein